ncbi:MAG: hypothetical protein GC192_11415 [Bacteroidetes bacterium]|nr:hypothetical protein [Bacteroidota bacterium]
MLQTLGRLHILALHLPIGFLILAYLMDLFARSSNSALRPAVGLSLFWSMLSAVIAATLGYLLSLDGSYDEELLNLHKWLGFATAGLSVALYFFHKNRPDSKFFFPFFTAAIFVLAATGHYGGSLTHGADFLFEGEKTDVATSVPITNLDSTQVFQELVFPILKNKCGNCHNPSKRKGDLVVLNKEDLLKGGKHGLAINIDQPDSGLLLIDIHLPLESKKHMPPKGKTQLTDTEKQLLDWWLKAGAPFDKTVVAAAMPTALRSSLQANNQAPSSPLDGLKLDPVSEAALKKLRDEGIQVFPLASGSPFLQVLLQGKQDVTAQQLDKLKAIGPNIAQLNLSNSNVDDVMLTVLKDMPHLNRLYLEQTNTTDKGLANLKELSFLEYLNLYQTKVTDAGLATLQSLPKLRSLYLWQSGVTPDGVAKFASQKPDIFIDKGIENDSIFGKVALKAPRITATKELFSDTVQVLLEAGFSKVKIHYTTDGTEPDSTSSVYSEPIVLSESSEVKAIAYLEGWSTSPSISKTFVKVGYQPVGISLALPPDPRYKGDGEKTLIDFQRGGDSFKSGKWFGWQGHNCVATLNLGKITEVSKVAVGSFEDTGGWIFFPKGLRISTSTDGKNFKKAKESSYPIPAKESKSGAKMFQTSFLKTQAQFVKVEVLSILKNPDWHPNKGKPSWIFLDEILVE